MCEGSLAVVPPPSLPTDLVAEEIRRRVDDGMAPTEALVLAAASVRRLLGPA